MVVVIGMAMLALTACAGVQSKEEGKQSEPEAGQEQLGGSLSVYCGAGMQKPFQEIADVFEEETGCEMNVTYANAAQIQTQIKESQAGDFFISGSSEELNPVSDYVLESVDLVKHIPVLAVAEGNKKEINGLLDLARDDVQTVIGDPESTPIGKIAKKAFADYQIADKVHLVATTTTAPQLATVISMGEADAAIIWKENADADGVEICETKDLDSYVKTIPAAKLAFVEDSKAADAFWDFLQSETTQKIWTSYGYEVVK